MNRNMPGGDGWAAAVALAAALPLCRVVFFGAVGAERDYDRAAALGAVGYLHKGVEPVELQGHIWRVTAGGTAWPPLPSPADP